MSFKRTKAKKFNNHAKPTAERLGMLLLKELAKGPQANMSRMRDYVDLGADMSVRNADGEPPLVAATARGNVIAYYIVSKCPAAVNICDAGNNSPLLVAAYYGRESFAEDFLRARADTSVCNDRGMKAVDFAHAMGYPRIANMIESYERAFRREARQVRNSMTGPGGR